MCEFSIIRYYVTTFYHADLDDCQDDPFCKQFCHLSSRSLTIATDVSQRARVKLTEIGMVTSLLKSLEKFASLPYGEVSLVFMILTGF